ncbi:hypothetical protein QP157_02560 [Sphingomonas sp. LR61]|uniref:hypothetical protein n=1 Tax=Sphingomonas sp. LR61 TaxID=3050234 RepID=UPI002FDF1C89
MLDFAFYPDAPEPTPAAIAAAAEEFHELMHRSGWLWSPYNWPLEKRRFTKRLEDACAGTLVPVEHVKDIDRGAHEYLFEIRWKIKVLEQLPDGKRANRSVEVRLYHAEPSTMTDVFVGLHLHEKQIVKGNTRATRDLQDAQIDIAIARFHEGRPVHWGLP